MTKDEKLRQIAHIKSEVNTPKDRLADYAYKLEEIGAIREARSLFTIIYKLEEWQNK